ILQSCESWFRLLRPGDTHLLPFPSPQIKPLLNRLRIIIKIPFFTFSNLLLSQLEKNMIDYDIRLMAVERFKTLELDNDPEFKELIQLASEICDTPVALITLMDNDVQWLKVRHGTDVTEMPVATSFCKHTLQLDDLMVVNDATLDERFVNNPIVANDPNIRFYAGAPLKTSEGQSIGSLCVLDVKPQNLNKHQLMMLKMLSRQVIGLMELRMSMEMLEKNKKEADAQRAIIKKAEISQRSFFESAPNFHVLLNKNCEVIDFNRVAYEFIKKMHGVKLTRGKMFIPYLAPDFIEAFLEGYKLALKGQKAFKEGFTDYGTNGLIYWEASFETARDADSQIIGISYIIRDVSDRKVREHKIIAQNQSLLKIAHMQAHEFRAPLTTITGMMGLIKAEDYKAPKEYFEMLEHAVETLDRKIREIVDNVDNTVLVGTEVYKAG
ncbi:MAG: PAS domain S-box protein, partial [Mucilaginibacter sp.]